MRGLAFDILFGLTSELFFAMGTGRVRIRAYPSLPLCARALLRSAVHTRVACAHGRAHALGLLAAQREGAELYGRAYILIMPALRLEWRICEHACAHFKCD